LTSLTWKNLNAHCEAISNAVGGAIEALYMSA
jgi:hypothetical protein